jgi:hypothetical protein
LFCQVLFPNCANDFEFPFDGGRSTPELRRNFVDGISLHLQRRDRPHLVVRQIVKESLILFGELSHEFRTWRFGKDLFKTDLPLTIVIWKENRRFSKNLPAAALLPRLISNQTVSFSSGDRDKQMPQFISIVQLRETTFLCSSKETVKRAERYVLRICSQPSVVLQPLTG